MNQPMKPKTKEELHTLLRERGWKLVWQDSFIMPPTSAEIWQKRGEPYQIRLGWPLNEDCNGATTTEIEIAKAMHMMGMDAAVEDDGGNAEQPETVCPGGCLHNYADPAPHCPGCAFRCTSYEIGGADNGGLSPAT